MGSGMESPWLATLVLLLLAGGARLLGKSWRSPSAFVLGIWFVYVVVPLAIAPEFKVSGLAVWSILALVACMALGAIVGEGRPVPTMPAVGSPLNGDRLLHVTLVFNAVGLVGAVEYLLYGLRINQLSLSLSEIAVLAHINALNRYVGGPEPPWPVRLLILWVFPAAIVGGIAYNSATTWRRRLLCLTFVIPTLLYSIVNAARANTLIAVSVAVGGYLAMRAAMPGMTVRRTSRRALTTGVAAVAAAVSFFAVVDSVRGHEENKALEVTVDWTRLKAVSIGYLAVYSEWADQSDSFSISHPMLGGYTFGGIFDAVGLRQREIGVYHDFVRLGDSQSNNLYTAFRGVIEDFSFVGAMLFFLAMGFGGGYAYRRCALGQQVWVPWLALFYAFVIWSPIISVLNYNSPLIAAITAGILLRSERRPHSALQPQPSP
jgi:oligosaccharide repeat unit polymerase